jgi:hypothetical protein
MRFCVCLCLRLCRDVLVRPTDPEINQKGLGGPGGLTKEVLEHWDSYRYEAAQHNTIAQHRTQHQMDAVASCRRASIPNRESERMRTDHTTSHESHNPACSCSLRCWWCCCCRLCAHPDRTDDEITRKGEEVWDEWWARFLTELEVRWKVPDNRYLPLDSNRRYVYPPPNHPHPP